MKFRDVLFAGQSLVLLRFDEGDGALAFPHQVKADGNIKLGCQFEPGFAHIDHDGQIWRHKHPEENANTHPDLAEHWRALK